MLADTENRRFRRSSTAAIMRDVVRWAYFRCHVYESKDTSFFNNRLFGRFSPAVRMSVNSVQQSSELIGTWRLKDKK